MTLFRELFGREPALTAQAHGRVNLIGEHTDYNGGFVLPALIPQTTRVALAPRGDGQVRAASTWAPGELAVYALGGESRRGAWIDYVQGITSVLRESGHTVTGFDLLIDSDIPVGSGLSSSAALEVSLLRALRQLAGLTFDDVALAQMGQRAEHRLVGAMCGIMDQMVCSLGEPGTALLLDCRSLAWKRVALPAGVEIAVIHSGVTHDLSQGDYNTRRAECERACDLLDVAVLRDLSVGDLPEIERLPEPLNRRARHVVTENARVLRAAEAIESGNVALLGQLFFESHASMRDDYQVSVPAVDSLVELARIDSEVLGARLTGGGFGGCVIVLCPRGHASDIAQRLVAAHRKRFGPGAHVLIPAIDEETPRPAAPDQCAAAP